ncbi:MAG TPA: site-2 protease family protein [Bacteroidetes bacterium]|nr:site-2 protease family protein [Bacteroidota bacterium]
MLLHWSFILLFVFLLYYGCSENYSLHEFLWWAAFGGALFLSILLHEFGHALMAKRYGVKTKDITLLPIGGMARLNRLPDKPKHELLVAVAGPLVNVGIAILLVPHFWWIVKPALAQHEIPAPENIDNDFFFFLPLLLFLNLLLAVFNMLPAFPMDGGRMLRALLSIKWGRLRATKAAVFIGHFIAAAMVIFGIWRNQLSYTFIGAFIYFTANREYRWVKTESLLKSIKVSDLIASGIIIFENINSLPDLSIDANDNLKKANEIMQQHDRYELAVHENGVPIGVLENEKMWDYISEMEKEK